MSAGNSSAQNAVQDLVLINAQLFVGPALAWEINYLEKCGTLGVSRQTVIDQGYQAEIEATQAAVEKLRAADVLIVDGNPIDDVRVLKNHSKISVIKGGEIKS